MIIELEMGSFRACKDGHDEFEMVIIKLVKMMSLDRFLGLI